MAMSLSLPDTGETVLTGKTPMHDSTPQHGPGGCFHYLTFPDLVAACPAATITLCLLAARGLLSQEEPEFRNSLGNSETLSQKMKTIESIQGCMDVTQLEHLSHATSTVTSWRARLSRLHVRRSSSRPGTSQARVHLRQREGTPACRHVCQSVSYPLLDFTHFSYPLTSLTVMKDNGRNRV